MVAIYWHPDGYDTSGKELMGRHAAGEGFIRGYVRHGVAPEIVLFNAVEKPVGELEPLLRRLEPTEKPLRWISRGDRKGLRSAGVLNLPIPALGPQAWARELGDARAYSICGVTHTTATARVLDILAGLTIAPVRPWDALVCTSRAVRASILAQNEMVDEHLRSRLGATTLPRPEYPVIPLGVSTADFESSDGARAEWRDRLGIGDDDVAVLYVGRWNLTSKMNPAVMAMALERAAARTSRQVHWIMAGWALEPAEQQFKITVEAHLEKVRVHWVDGRPSQTRRTIWSSADLFISLSDNIQETFGLTPVEAMAAGLPVVISDWNGYKDTVRHGVDGFRIATATPPAGLGRDLAFAFDQEWLAYDAYVSAVSQLTAVDLEASVQALIDLIDNAELRRRMGAAARARARDLFDWSRVIPQYEALWSELDARRNAAPPEAPRSRNASDNPWRPDPFRMYASYPTEWVTSTSMLGAAPDMTWAAAQAVMAKPMVRYFSQYLPAPDEVRIALETLDGAPQMMLADVLQRFPAGRRPFIERGVVWMAKYGLLRILGRSTHIPS